VEFTLRESRGAPNDAGYPEELMQATPLAFNLFHTPATVFHSSFLIGESGAAIDLGIRVAGFSNPSCSGRQRQRTYDVSMPSASRVFESVHLVLHDLFTFEDRDPCRLSSMHGQASGFRPTCAMVL
jgi:hypothetical protein